MSTLEWSELMQAPWGKFDKESRELKQEALDKYTRESEKFWNTRCQCAYNQDKHLRKEHSSIRREREAA